MYKVLTSLNLCNTAKAATTEATTAEYHIAHMASIPDNKSHSLTVLPGFALDVTKSE
jgi:hypothetical protein